MLHEQSYSSFSSIYYFYNQLTSVLCCSSASISYTCLSLLWAHLRGTNCFPWHFCVLVQVPLALLQWTNLTASRAVPFRCNVTEVVCTNTKPVTLRPIPQEVRAPNYKAKWIGAEGCAALTDPHWALQHCKRSLLALKFQEWDLNLWFILVQICHIPVEARGESVTLCTHGTS